MAQPQPPIQLIFLTPGLVIADRSACNVCRRLKRKCDSKHPCGRCSVSGATCSYDNTGKSSTPKKKSSSKKNRKPTTASSSSSSQHSTTTTHDELSNRESDLDASLSLVSPIYSPRSSTQQLVLRSTSPPAQFSFLTNLSLSQVEDMRHFKLSSFKQLEAFMRSIIPTLTIVKHDDTDESDGDSSDCQEVSFHNRLFSNPILEHLHKSISSIHALKFIPMDPNHGSINLEIKELMSAYLSTFIGTRFIERSLLQKYYENHSDPFSSLYITAACLKTILIVDFDNAKSSRVSRYSSQKYLEKFFSLAKDCFDDTSLPTIASYLMVTEYLHRFPNGDKLNVYYAHSKRLIAGIRLDAPDHPEDDGGLGATAEQRLEMKRRLIWWYYQCDFRERFLFPLSKQVRIDQIQLGLIEEQDDCKIDYSIRPTTIDNVEYRCFALERRLMTIMRYVTSEIYLKNNRRTTLSNIDSLRALLNLWAIDLRQFAASVDNTTTDSIDLYDISDLQANQDHTIQTHHTIQAHQNPTIFARLCLLLLKLQYHGLCVFAFKVFIPSTDAQTLPQTPPSTPSPPPSTNTHFSEASILMTAPPEKLCLTAACLITDLTHAYVHTYGQAHYISRIYYIIHLAHDILRKHIEQNPFDSEIKSKLESCKILTTLQS